MQWECVTVVIPICSPNDASAQLQSKILVSCVKQDGVSARAPKSFNCFGWTAWAHSEQYTCLGQEGCLVATTTGTPITDRTGDTHRNQMEEPHFAADK